MPNKDIIAYASINFISLPSSASACLLVLVEPEVSRFRYSCFMLVLCLFAYVTLCLCDTCRPDHNMQDIRAKIFPLRRRKIQAPEVMPSISLPVKRKERSLSSLVVNTPKVSIQTGLTGKRTKVNARKAAALRVCGFSVEDKKEDSAEDRTMSSSSPDSLNKITSNKRQVKEAEHLFFVFLQVKFEFDYVAVCQYILYFFSCSSF